MNNEAFYAGKRVLVTGGLGFIGSNLTERLVLAGAKVTVIDSMLPGCGANRFNLANCVRRVAVIESDIGDTASFEAALLDTAVIFNLAGEISHSRSMSDPERDLNLNTVSQLRFLLACGRLCPGARVVYGGTRQVYGKPDYLPVDENHPIQPVDFNGIHKYAATQYHLLMTRRGELDCVVLRLSNVYGPRMAISLPQQGFLGVYMRRVLRGEPLTVYGDGAQLRDPAHVDDVVDAFLAAGAAPALRSRTFNVGGPDALSLAAIAEIMSREGGCGDVRRVPFPEHLSAIDIGSFVSDSSRLGRELGVIPRIGFTEGVRATLAYYRQHGPHYGEPESLGSGVTEHLRLLAAVAVP
jgi:nucleoside-diphosphate-sugar epimerase